MTPQKTEQRESPIITRMALGTEEAPVIRSIDKENHTADFVIATEAPVRDWSWRPPLSLSMKGASLKRYKANPVVLAQHRQGLLEVVGRTLKLWFEEGQLIARVQFDTDDEFANRVWGKVMRGFLKAASAGFLVTRKRLVREGQSDKKSGLEGPVEIATGWELTEWSIVAVGADPDALGRQLAAEEAPESTGDDEFTLVGCGLRGIDLQDCTAN